MSATSAASGRTTTNGRGEYVIADLASGEYELVFTVGGFKTARQRVQLQRQHTVVPNVRLEIGTVQEVVVPSTITQRSDVVYARTVSDLLDAAKAHYEHGRYAEAEAMTSQALEVIRTVLRRSSAVATPALDTATPVRVGGNIREPKKIKHIDPAYPEDARRSTIEGDVIIELVIEKDGTIADAKVLSGQHVFQEAALNAVKQWRYTPTTLDGVPVQVIMNVTVRFRLK
jgi:TonB family protein